MLKVYLIKRATQIMMLVALCFVSSSHLFAESLFQFQNLSKKDGLSSSVVYDVAQDKNGFVWFATEDGLQKYDGVELVTYRYNRMDDSSLSNNIVRILFSDEEGNLWIGTENGLNLYQYENNSFIRFSSSGKTLDELNSSRIRSIYQTSDKTIWVGTTEGLSSIDPITRKIKSYPHKKIRAIFEDEYQQIWVGTLGDGLFLFNRVSAEFTPINRNQSLAKDNASSTDMSRLNIIDIQQDSFGRIFVATWGEGVYLLKRDARVLTKENFNLPSPFVRNMLFDEEGQIWFATKKGIFIVDSSQKNERLIKMDESNQRSLQAENILKIYQSDDHAIWVGTYGGGVSRYFPKSRKFETFGIHPDINEGLIDPVVYALSENDSGNIWIGSENGKLALFDVYSNRFKHFKLRINGEEKVAEIKDIVQISESTILIGTVDGLLNYNFKTDKLRVYNAKDSSFLQENQYITFIRIDENKRLWIGVEGKGIAAFTVSNSGDLRQIENLYLETQSPRNLIHRAGTSSLLFSDSDNIKVLRVNENPELEQLKLEIREIPNTDNLSVTGVDVDWKNRFWIGTSSDGVKILDESESLHSLDEVSGLPNNSIWAVVADADSNRIWISSNLGITAINPDNMKTTDFSLADGLQGNEFTRPGILSSSGYLYFGGVNGFNRFYPTASKEDLIIKPPQLLGLTVIGDELGVRDTIAQLNPSLFSRKKVQLNFDQMPFSISFTSPQFVSPESLKFRYRLKGLSDKWITSSNNKVATYTNLSAGTYEFELQVGTKKGEWNGYVNSLTVQVSPPWWFTSWATAIYSSMLLGVIVILYSVRHRKKSKEKRVQLAIKENEERLKLALWGSGYEFWDWNLETGEISRSNEFKNILIDCPRLSKSLFQLASYIHPNDLGMVRTTLSEHIAGNTKYFDLCYRVVDAQSGWRWIQDRGKVVAVDSNGNALRISGTQRDVTDLKVRDEQFDMLGQAFKNTSDGVWIRDREWRLVECNPAFEKITGFTLEQKRGEILWFPEIQEQAQNLTQRIRNSIQEKGSWQGEVWAERKNEEAFPQKLSIDTLHDEKGNVRYYVGVFSDITFHKRTEEEFRKLANYDSLTGLPNRACLYDRLNQTIEKTKRDNGRIALILIDIDNFKRINDSLGHSVGDILIRQVASRLVNCNKEGDTVARIGGDEFVIVMESVKSSSAVATFSELLLKELNQPIFVKGQQLKLNFSIGITLAPDDAIIAERLLRNADTAMYEAKKKIENSYRFYSVEFNERAKKRLALENALRKAVDDDLIELFYQPKIDLNTGLVDGLEALARWTHKELGFISPSEFIPLAEETGLIIPLGRNLMYRAFRQTKEWVDSGVMRGRTSINLSAYQFWNRNLANEVSQILDEVGLNSKFIELEITESACMQDMEETKSQIIVLKALGISLALDDFGTGYSSLAQLKALPFDTLKVDKSFVDNIETNVQDAKVVKAIIDIAKTMEMKVVIEGVESRSQCEYLWKNRAYIVQGYYFSRPIKAALVAEVFGRKWHRKDYLGNLAVNISPF